MTSLDMYSIASEINLRAKSHRIGELQEIRKDLKGLNRLPGQDIFSSLTTKKDYAFHHGGRRELQFNIGFENVHGIDELRHGVAFSLETSQTLPAIEPLIPKIRLFNEFLQLYSEDYSDMRMWHYRGEQYRSSDYMPSPIPPELVIEKVFIFLGKCQPVAQLDYEALLNDLDRFLPLYKYVESGGNLQPISAPMVSEFEFRPGFTAKASSTVATQARKQLDIRLRHNDIEQAMYERLAAQYGAENVAPDHPSGVGTRVDLMVRRKDGYWYYEIKTAHSPRACLREAIGQLLEYAFWPGGQEVTCLIVVGETALDKEGTDYLHKLKERFSLPLEYEQIVV